MDFITENIAIGSRADAENGAALRRAEITAVLNVAADLDVPVRAETARVVPLERRYKVGLVDGGGNSPYLLLAAVSTLHALQLENERTLVHCWQGVSRSTIVVATYLATREELPLERAVGRIRERRPFANPHPALVVLAKRVLDRFQPLLTAMSNS